ncbi:primosomal protein N', partial [Xanthomonas sp. LMG 12461]
MPSPAATLPVALPVPLPHLFAHMPPPGGAAADGDGGRRGQVPFGNREMSGVGAASGQGEDAGGPRGALAWLDHVPLVPGERSELVRWL